MLPDLYTLPPPKSGRWRAIVYRSSLLKRKKLLGVTVVLSCLVDPKYINSFRVSWDITHYPNACHEHPRGILKDWPEWGRCWCSRLQGSRLPLFLGNLRFGHDLGLCRFVFPGGQLQGQRCKYIIYIYIHWLKNEKHVICRYLQLYPY